jgi:tight adherence protein B
MNVVVIAFIVILLIVAFVALAILLKLPLPFLGGAGSQGQMHSLVSVQRSSRAALARGGEREKSGLLQAFHGGKTRVRNDSVLTLRKRLKYAQWPIPPTAFHSLEVVISVVTCILVHMRMNMLMTLLALLAGPILMRWLLNTMVDRRFKRFDGDYPQFLMSLVGLLKTGMTSMGALDSAAQGLEEGSLVKEECEVMLERMRFGVSEDKSIGSFGEDIYHPEIELFVQALLLSRRLGGALSETLERLSKQVRKRQYFRRSAVAAVGMQRGSIWIIILLLCLLEGYIYFMYPVLVTEAFKTPMGWQVWQAGILFILLGIFWVRQVTKIRI